CFCDRETDCVVLTNDFGEPDRGVDGVELTIDIDLPQLADQDHSGIAILWGVSCRDRDRQPLVRPVAKPIHDGPGLLAVFLHVRIVTRQGLEDFGRHSPYAFGWWEHDSTDLSLPLAQDLDRRFAIQR